MITDNTVFILGAGASKPYNYPTGSELRLNICRKFIAYLEALKKPDIELQIQEQLHEAEKFTTTFFKSDTSSIDLFLSRNQIYSDIGKISIVLSILKAEYKSKFHEDVQDNNQNWYSFLFHKMTNSLTTPDSYNDFRCNKVSFITFNYDRSLEYFLYESFSNSFSLISKENIINILKKIPIYHVYGAIDKLPWQGGKLEYQSKYNNRFQEIMYMKDNIKIIQERTKQPSSEIEEALSNAKRIFFLGFGYALENLEVLGIPKLINIDDKQTFGTGYGLFERDITEIRRYINKKYAKNPLRTNPVIENCDCCTLLKKYL